MLVQYTFTLQPERPCRVTPELGYRFYSALLLFAECAGVGVKTTLGMGGVELVL